MPVVKGIYCAHFLRGFVGKLNRQHRFCHIRRGGVSLVIGYFHFAGVGICTVIHLVHIPHDLPKPVQVIFIYESDRGSILCSAGAGSKNRQDILPRDGVAAIVGHDLLAVVRYVVFNLFQPVLVFTVQLYDGLLNGDPGAGRFPCEKDSER